MRRLHNLMLALTLLLVATACGGGGISASNCDEVVDETVALIQQLIDDVDAEFGELSVQDFIATGGNLPSVERFEASAEQIDAVAADLGCTQSQIAAGLDVRVNEFTASTDLGRFLIDAIRSGGL